MFGNSFGQFWLIRKVYVFEVKRYNCVNRYVIVGNEFGWVGNTGFG